MLHRKAIIPYMCHSNFSVGNTVNMSYYGIEDKLAVPIYGTYRTLK